MLWSSHPHDKLSDKVYKFYFGDESGFMQHERLELNLDRNLSGVQKSSSYYLFNGGWYFSFILYQQQLGKYVMKHTKC